jgi:hypothetical protein
MRRSFGRLCLVLALLATFGCSRTTRDPSLPRVERNVLTHEQVLETRTTNAYEAVETLRSNWLRTRGIDSFSSPGQVLVYFNETRLGGVETLRSIGLNDIGYIRYFDGREASARWGLDHGHGVIYITTLPPL